MSNILCYLLGHNEVHDMQWPVSWCHRCGVEMSTYNYEHDIPKTLNIWNRVRDIVFVARVELSTKYRKLWRRVDVENDIPF